MKGCRVGYLCHKGVLSGLGKSNQHPSRLTLKASWPGLPGYFVSVIHYSHFDVWWLVVLGLLCSNYGLLLGIVACCFGPLGFPGSK